MPSARAKRLQAIENRLLASLRAARSTASAASGVTGSSRLTLVLYEAGFIRAFVAWERFLEESFISYLMGQNPIRGRAPHRYYSPRNRDAAWEFLREVSGRRRYVDWTDPLVVKRRAEAVFRNGGCFQKLSAANQDLQDMRKVRNAISHHSDEAREKFEELVRRELKTLPLRATPGSFLGTAEPKGGGARTFLDKYLDLIEQLAKGIARR